ncbi:hypothetical protein [Pseudoalteromonas sp. HF66]|uniref:hypothetical protein n=1 Tax=Pseudoalteromonas sp. HF66 TaxID=2721559 RepID=UPI001C37D773|nr:hypothetical protein [Pseudoalteromonas sp. HF66]
MHHIEEFDTWAGLNLLAVDGVVWRAAYSDENREAFSSASNQYGDTGFSQNRMVGIWNLPATN